MFHTTCHKFDDAPQRFVTYPRRPTFKRFPLAEIELWIEQRRFKWLASSRARLPAQLHLFSLLHFGNLSPKSTHTQAGKQSKVRAQSTLEEMRKNTVHTSTYTCLPSKGREVEADGCVREWKNRGEISIAISSLRMVRKKEYFLSRRKPHRVTPTTCRKEVIWFMN